MERLLNYLMSPATESLEKVSNWLLATQHRILSAQGFSRRKCAPIGPFLSSFNQALTCFCSAQSQQCCPQTGNTPAKHPEFWHDLGSHPKLQRALWCDAPGCAPPVPWTSPGVLNVWVEGDVSECGFLMCWDLIKRKRWK